MATRFASRLVTAVLCALTAGAPMLARQSNPRIGPHDQVVITVVGVKQFTNKYPVGPDGTIEFPQLGRLTVGGLTTGEVSELVTRRLKEADIVLNPQVSVELEQTPTKRVMVNGAVRTQGPVAFAGELTLLEAIVRAGGRLPEASDVVLVVRAPAGGGAVPEAIDVDVRELEAGVLTHNLVLRDGDAVFVKKAQAVTITGQVRNVGAYNIESGSTVEQALALAGGLTDRGSEKRIEITRKVGGKTVRLKGVKLTDLVKPGDIIKVGAKIV